MLNKTTQMEDLKLYDAIMGVPDGVVLGFVYGIDEGLKIAGKASDFIYLAMEAIGGNEDSNCKRVIKNDQRIKEYFSRDENENNVQDEGVDSTQKETMASLEEDTHTSESKHVMQTINDCGYELNKIIDFANQNKVTEDELDEFRMAAKNLERRASALSNWSEDLKTNDWVAETDEEDWV